MIRRGREMARLMNPNSRRRRSTGGWRSLLRRQRTTIGAEPRKRWIEYDKSDSTLLDGAASLRGFKAKDGEKQGVVGEGVASVHAVEDERQGFDFDDDDDSGHSSDSSGPAHPFGMSNLLFIITEIVWFCQPTLCYVRVSYCPVVRSYDHHRVEEAGVAVHLLLKQADPR